MKLRLIPALIALTLVWVSSVTYAENVHMLKISSEYFPDDVYEIGFELTEKDLISRVYFNEMKNEPAFFTLNELQNSYVTVFKKFGFNFVKMKILKMDSETSGTIELSILKYAVLGKRQSIFYDVKLNPATGHYEIADRRTGRSLSNLIVITNFRGGVPVGIRDIQEK